MDATAELRKLNEELTTALEQEKKLAATYHDQLLETRHKLVTKDYGKENAENTIKELGKVIQSLTKENQVLKDLVKANAMLHLEIL